MRMRWRNHWSDCLDLWKVSSICISWYTDELSTFIVIGIIEHSLNLSTNFGLYKTKKMLNETTKRNKQLHCRVARSTFYVRSVIYKVYTIWSIFLPSIRDVINYKNLQIAENELSILHRNILQKIRYISW